MNKLPFDPPQLENFVEASWIEHYFSNKECDTIIDLFKKKQSLQAQVSDEGIHVPELRKSMVCAIEPNNEEYQGLIVKLAQLAIQVNAQKYQFELSGIYEPLQIAKYGVNDLFDWHSDFSMGDASTRKLSLSVQLSSPSDYEGGDLQIMKNTQVINTPRTRGTVIIFPSFVQHRVTPITNGERMSFVAWIAGPHFK